MSKKKYMPLFINLDEKFITIFGGGVVGERKARLFSQYAKVRVVSREFTPQIIDLASNGKIELIHTDDILKTADLLLHDSYIAIICTNDSKLNNTIEKRAKEFGVLRNIVDVSDPGDIIVPAIANINDLFVAISTQGSAPLISSQLRKRIVSLFHEESWVERLKIMKWARKRIQPTINSFINRKHLLYIIYDDNIVNKEVSANNLDAARRRVNEIILEYSINLTGGKNL